MGHGGVGAARHLENFNGSTAALHAPAPAPPFPPSRQQHIVYLPLPRPSPMLRA